MNPHTLILTPDILARLDAAGFSGGDLGAWLADRAERAQDFEDDYKRAVDDAGAPDEVHCSCVPHLRRRIAEVEGQRDDESKSRAIFQRLVERTAAALGLDKPTIENGQEAYPSWHDIPERVAVLLQQVETLQQNRRDHLRREREREAKITHAHDAIIGVVRHGTDDVGGDPKAEIREGLDRVEPDPILSALLAEVARAEGLHGPLPLGECSASLFFVFAEMERQARADLARRPPTALAILAEEVGELGRATTPEEQREEAIQVMAVCYRLMRALSGCAR